MKLWILHNRKHQNCINRDIRELIPNSRAHRVLGSGRKEINQLMNVYGVLVSTNRVPIIVNKKVMGAVLTFILAGKVSNLTKGEEYAATKIPEHLLKLVEGGGLIPYLETAK